MVHVSKSFHLKLVRFSLIEENLLEDNIVNSRNIAKRIQFDGKLQLLWFANTVGHELKLEF